MKNSIGYNVKNNVIPISRGVEIRDKLLGILTNEESYKWSKNDIIWALLSHGTLDVDWDSVDLLLQEEYLFLYEKLSDFICSIWEVSYHERWYTFKYDENKKCIYFMDISSIGSPEIYRLDIKLITKEDYSSTSIEISYEDNIMFILWEEWYGMTWYIPWDYDF